uniref:5-demethoxyubiquinone hydroxylase, mitochondrial n=1 Tax=Romanomermis culicivorax TaxID=13658 RepID=A0A915JW44_ROMCU
MNAENKTMIGRQCEMGAKVKRVPRTMKSYGAFRCLAKGQVNKIFVQKANCSSSASNINSWTPIEENAQEIKRQELLDRIIRVDHAGELGADRIYAGQSFILGKTEVGATIKHMWEQEKEHLETFERLIPKHRVRPTALLPFWNAAGFMLGIIFILKLTKNHFDQKKINIDLVFVIYCAKSEFLGATTALLGKEGAMACTVAVEEVIADHYNDQIRELLEDNPEKNKELLEVVKKFRDDEIEHHDTGLENDALKVIHIVDSVFLRLLKLSCCSSLQAPFYSILKQSIQFGCRGAIWLSERI